MYFSIPDQLYDFLTLAQIEKLELVGERPRKIIDVCGIIKEVDENTSSITIKSQNREVAKVKIISNLYRILLMYHSVN